MNCYRLSSARYPAYSGTGAAAYGGRWNPKGVEAIYAAASVSLAALEVLVHFATLPRDFVLTRIEVPDDCRVTVVDLASLPPGWDAPDSHASTRAIGKRWAASLESAVLMVPSAVVHTEVNYILNPKHPDFPRIAFGRSEPFRFDPRLR